MIEIAEIWKKYELALSYPVVDKYIQNLKQIERMHGRLQNIESEKKHIVELLLKSK